MIIVVSVVCSVVAVLGILTGLEMYAVNESQKAVAIELERQAVCERLYDNLGSLKEIELWGVCINYGIVEVVNDEVSDCGTGSHYSAQMCRMDTKILAMKVVNQEITLDTKFRDSFSSDLSNLQESRSMLFEQRQFEEQQNKIKFAEMEILEKEWISKYLLVSPLDWNQIYEECLTSEIKHYDTDFLHQQLCDNTVQFVINEKCEAGFGGTCGLKFNDVKLDQVTESKLMFNTESDKYSRVAESCFSQGDGTYLVDEQAKGCICKEKIDYYGWVELCKNTSSFSIQNTTIIPTVPYSQFPWYEIYNNYSKCNLNIQDEINCIWQFGNDIDEYCRMTTDSNSENPLDKMLDAEEYEECRSNIRSLVWE